METDKEGSVTVDSKYRVVLGRKVRAVSGISKGDQLTAIPFNRGVILVSTTGKKFVGSLTGFEYREEKHQADRYLVKLSQDDDADS